MLHRLSGPGSEFTFQALHTGHWADLGWWHPPWELIVQSSTLIQLQGPDLVHPGKHRSINYGESGEIEIEAFLISPSLKCIWSGLFSWLALFFRIFAAIEISKLHRRNLLVSWLHWITAMVKCWLHRGLPPWAHLMAVVAMWNSQPLTKCYQLSPLSCQIKL